jgi:hypothetical protein
MLKLRATVAIIALASTACPVAASQAADESRWNKTTAIKEVPFCALILRNFTPDHGRRRELYVLMEPEQVLEENLFVLFRALSDKYPRPGPLEIWVETDVQQLADLATGKGWSGSAGIDRPLQLAYYKRNSEVELFRFNPAFPESGEKTVVIRGKE